MDKTSSTESTSRLREAISKLEAFSFQQTDPVSSVSKTMSLVYSIFAGRFSAGQKKSRLQRHPPDRKDVLKAVEQLNRYRFLIEKLKKGTPAEQELAEKVTEAINNYNDNCDKRIQACLSGKHRLTQFFSKHKLQDQELPKIILPKKITVQRHFPEHLLPKEAQKITSNAAFAVPISKQSAELFHMKAIALLEKYGIASNYEARAFVKKTPIHTTIEKDTSTCTLTQTLSLFPGQTIIVMGSSALDPKTHALSRLFPETFCLSMESTQTGFPHPTQRAGWTLAGQLLPEFPQRIDLLDKAANLIQRKNLAITGLLQQGALLKHAKELLSLKKKCFEIHAKELIELQKTLNLAILKAASAEPAAYEIVERFFQSLHTHPNPFEVLADASKLIRETFMMKPHQSLLDAIIKGKSTDLGNRLPEIRYAAASALLDNSVILAKQEIRTQKEDVIFLNERTKLEYVECLGSIFGEASKRIFLQYLSEDLIFESPRLTRFECKAQAAAYQHLKDFLDELEDETVTDPERIYALLKRQIIDDTAVFIEDSRPDIAKELADYFYNRYISLSLL